MCRIAECILTVRQVILMARTSMGSDEQLMGHAPFCRLEMRRAVTFNTTGE
jgi:hypothetical protein